MKTWYDKDAEKRVFSPGALQVRYHWPYTVESKVGEVDYIVKTPDRPKNRQLCHVNMLKEYVDRNESSMAKAVCYVLVEVQKFVVSPM